jgi:hypothetical protein
VRIERELRDQQEQTCREQNNANDVAQPPGRARLLCIFASHAQRVTKPPGMTILKHIFARHFGSQIALQAVAKWA